ncbi:MAG: hypothetical protein ACPG5B_08130, partial [Chitinophagales bacterium]
IADFLASSQNGLVLWYMLGDYTDCLGDLFVAFPDVSASCSISAFATTPVCDDNGTGSDSSDDTYTFDVTVSGTDTGGSWSGGGTIAVYDTPISFGPYLISDGDQSFVITDDVDGSCITTVNVTAPPSCSTVTCSLTANVTNLICDDRETTDPDDDWFSFDLVVTGGSGQWSSPDLNTFFNDYNTVYTFDYTNINSPLYEISNGSWTFTITDTDDGSCSTNATVNPPASCSPECNWGSGFDTGDASSTITRDDQGTPDPNDDTVSGIFTIVAPSSSEDWSLTVKEPDPGNGHLQDYGPYSAGTTTISWGPVPIADFLASSQNGLVLWYMLGDYTDCLGDLFVEFPEVSSCSVIATGNGVCEGNDIQLRGEDGFVSYEWDGPDGFSSNDQNPSIIGATILANGIYNLTATDADGCVAIANVFVEVQEMPKPQELCDGDSIETTAPAGYTTYQWYKDGVAISAADGGDQQIYTITETGEYNYTLDGQALDGSCTNQMCCPLVIIVGSCPADCNINKCLPIMITKVN